MNNKTNKSIIAQKTFRKVYIVIGFGIIGLVALFVILGQIGLKAEEISKAKQDAASEVDVANYAFLKAEVEHYTEQIDELESLFANDSDLVLFVQEIDRLKRECVVTSFSFVSNDPIRDDTGNYGIPVSITFTGSEEQIDAALRTVQSLPFLLRGVQVDVSRESTEEGVENLILDYGGFLYVVQSNSI